MIIGFILIVLFVRFELRQKQPLLDLTVFRIKTYRYSIMVTSAASIGLFSGLFLIPYLIQEALGLGLIETGLVFLPSALASGVFMTLGGKLLDLKGPKFVVPPGLVLLAGASLIFGFYVDLSTPYWLIVVFFAIHGLV